MEEKIYTDYFYDPNGFDTQDAAYKPLKQYPCAPNPLNIPALLQPDKETASDVYYTVTAQAGEVQLVPGPKTKTWGYNAPLLGKFLVFKRGQHTHITLRNELPELTTFHWHGADVPGPITDGGCHAPVYPHQERKIDFTLEQPACFMWLHAHPCPLTAEQVYKGLATGVIIRDDVEAQLPFPRNYGVDDIPLVLQDRNFTADNQWDYQRDYDPDGVLGETPLINGTVNPYFDVTTQRVRLRILNGSNRREWRLHFSDDTVMTQIGSDGGIMPAPVKMTKLMLACAERAEVIIDFGHHQPGDTVTLYSDDTPILEFRIHDYAPDHTVLPDHLVDVPAYHVTPGTPVRKFTLDGTDDKVMINGKKFNMTRIDERQQLNTTEYWEITNTNSCHNGMGHPFHVHSTQFEIVSRNGHAPNPNEHGLKDTVQVNPQETVRLKVHFTCPGVFMYHCHIIEHEDGGMMGQIEVFDPEHPRTYELMNMKTLIDALATERGVKPEEVWMPDMEGHGGCTM